MSLTIIASRRRFRRFLAYYAEWKPGSLEVRLVGCFDGHRGYRAYRTFDAFLAAELTDRNRGCWFYAHAGGAYDVQFVLESIIHLARRGYPYRFKASFNGSSATVVHIIRGKNAWHFVDSYWLFRDKLANIAKWIGMQKTGPTDDMDEEDKKRWFSEVSFDELRRYNEVDCKILWYAIDAFETAILGMGGQLQMTLASCAMQLFRRRYLKSEVGTSESVNDYARESYFASRVEAFCRESFDSYYYDINSSFPFAMTLPVPGSLIGVYYGLPDRFLDLTAEESPWPYIVDIEFSVPDCYLPTMPVRMEGRVFFPVGRWRAWVNDIDLYLLLREGGRIIKAHRTMVFEPFMDLADYARDIYAKRMSGTTDFEKVVYKLLLNSLYGKFAESEFKQQMHFNPTELVLERLRDSPGADYLFPGAWIEEIEVPVPHMHVPISSAITARARRTLFQYLACSTDFHYCDTDGFSTGSLYHVGTALGELKLEKAVHHGVYIAPKLYRLDDKIKAKGFSLGGENDCICGHGKMHHEAFAKAGKERIGRCRKPNSACGCTKFNRKAEALFKRLIEEKEIEVMRMSRIRENFRRGIIAPNEKLRVKHIKTSNVPKRFMYPDGHTRPWSIGELREMLDKE